MRTTRKIITLIAVLALLFSSVIPAFAAEFSDLQEGMDGYWAKPYLDRMVERGIMAGYSDGTIRPMKSVSAAEAFVMLANLYDLNDQAKEDIHKDFGSVVEANVDARFTWSYKYVEICLAAGIVTEGELKNLTFDAGVPKQNLAVYMVRAIQKTAEAEKLANAELKYKDAADIKSTCLGSVALLSDMNVVGGDQEGNFKPKDEVTRAVFATMLCNILDYLDKGNIKLKIDGYRGLETVEGFLTSVSASGLIVRGNDGIYRSYPKAADFASTVNGANKALTSVYEGEPVKLQLEEGKAVTADVTETKDITYVQGRLNLIASNTVSLKVTDLLTGESGSYVVNEAKITQDGKEVNFTELTKGAFITMKLEKRTVKEVVSNTKEYTVTGKVGPIVYDTIVTMPIENEGEPDVILYLDLSDMPTIRRGSLNITIDRLTEGEDVKVTIKGGEVTRIQTQGKDATMTGVLTIITRTIKDTTWTIKAADGTSATYVLDSGASAFSGETAIKLDSINPGDEVSVTVTTGVITEVELVKSATPTTDKLSAEILAIDPNNRILTVLKDSKLVYINCKNVSSILNSETGKTISFSALAAGDMIVAYGSYTDSANFAATSIVVEIKH